MISFNIENTSFKNYQDADQTIFLNNDIQPVYTKDKLTDSDNNITFSFDAEKFTDTYGKDELQITNDSFIKMSYLFATGLCDNNLLEMVIRDYTCCDEINIIINNLPSTTFEGNLEPYIQQRVYKFDYKLNDYKFLCDFLFNKNSWLVYGNDMYLDWTSYNHLTEYFFAENKEHLVTSYPKYEIEFYTINEDGTENVFNKTFKTDVYNQYVIREAFNKVALTPDKGFYIDEEGKMVLHDYNNDDEIERLVKAVFEEYDSNVSSGVITGVNFEYGFDNVIYSKTGLMYNMSHIIADGYDFSDWTDTLSFVKTVEKEYGIKDNKYYKVIHFRQLV